MDNNKLFCYGILKRGYELDLNQYGAKFIGECHLEGAALYGIGPNWGGREGERKYHGVGLKLTPEGEFDVAHGELWEVPGSLWRWLDDIEQNGRVYERKIVSVNLETAPEIGSRGDDFGDNYLTPDITPTNAWVYVHLYEGFKHEDKIEGGKF